MIWIRRFCQYFIAAILLATSIGKMLDVQGFIPVLRSYQSFPEWSLPIVALAFVLVELKIGENLLRGRDLYHSAIAAIIIHVFFTLGAITTLLRGIDVPNCGCFGVFFARPLTWGTVVEDLVMLSACIGLFVTLRREGNHHVGRVAADAGHS